MSANSSIMLSYISYNSAPITSTIPPQGIVSITINGTTQASLNNLTFVPLTNFKGVMDTANSQWVANSQYYFFVSVINYGGFNRTILIGYEQGQDRWHARRFSAAQPGNNQNNVDLNSPMTADYDLGNDPLGYGIMGAHYNSVANGLSGSYIGTRADSLGINHPYKTHDGSASYHQLGGTFTIVGLSLIHI